jgi:hypothetical protein
LAKAYEAFLDAWKVTQHVQIALNLGHVEVELGKYCDAIEHLQYSLPSLDAKGSDATIAREWLAKAKAKVALLSISAEGIGVDVLIDDKSAGMAPLPRVCVDAGKHTIAARDGDARDEVTDTYEPGTTREVKLAPRKSVPPPAVKTATTSTVASALPGSSLPRPRKELLIGGGALAGAAFVAGAVFAGLSASMTGDVQSVRRSLTQGECRGNDDDPQCKQLFSLMNERNGFATAALWSFLGGAVVGGATVAYWFLAPRPSTTGTPSIRGGWL